MTALDDRWTLLILQNIVAGVRGFDDIQARLGVERTMLADRLRALVEDGLLDRVGSSDDYHLTQKGRDLEPQLAALLARSKPRPSGGGCLTQRASS
jgi:DNA-binding HxlR family transcriptional regulator